MNGMASIVISTIDADGCLFLPKEIRDKAQWEPGTPLQISYRDGHVEIEPAPREVRLVRKGRVLVAVPVEEGPTLTAEMVQETLDAIRNRKL